MAARSDSGDSSGSGPAASSPDAVDARGAGAGGGLSTPLTQGPQRTSITQQIQNLKMEQAANRAARAVLQKDLKNAQRRRRRLKGRVRQLTNEDLVAVLVMRNEANAAAASTGLPGTQAGAADAAPRSGE